MVPEALLDAHTRSVFDDAITYYVHANSHVLVYPIPGLDGSVKSSAAHGIRQGVYHR